MTIEIDTYCAVDKETMEKVKFAVAEEINKEGIDVDRVNLKRIEIDKNGNLEAELNHK